MIIIENNAAIKKYVQNFSSEGRKTEMLLCQKQLPVMNPYNP